MNGNKNLGQIGILGNEINKKIWNTDTPKIETNKKQKKRVILK